MTPTTLFTRIVPTTAAFTIASPDTTAPTVTVTAPNGGQVWALDEPWASRPHSLCLTVPPLAAVYLKPAP